MESPMRTAAQSHTEESGRERAAWQELQGRVRTLPVWKQTRWKETPDNYITQNRSAHTTEAGTTRLGHQQVETDPSEGRGAAGTVGSPRLRVGWGRSPSAQKWDSEDFLGQRKTNGTTELSLTNP